MKYIICALSLFVAVANAIPMNSNSVGSNAIKSNVDRTLFGRNDITIVHNDNPCAQSSGNCESDTSENINVHPNPGDNIEITTSENGCAMSTGNCHTHSSETITIGGNPKN